MFPPFLSLSKRGGCVDTAGSRAVGCTVEEEEIGEEEEEGIGEEEEEEEGYQSQCRRLSVAAQS